MGLQETWFILIALLFCGFLVLEGFDFGVGMLMIPLGRTASRRGEDADRQRRAVLNTIGPVWDGNEVWLITAGASMFAAFPVWYATLFSALYLPLLAILVAMIARIVGIEWRGKIDDDRWRRWADIGIAAGSWVPAALWGVAFAVLLQGLPIDADGRSYAGLFDIVNGYTLLGGLTTTAVFACYGAVFVALKTSGALRADAVRYARVLLVPAIGTTGAFGLWTQVRHGAVWTWVVVAVAATGLAVAAVAMRRPREGVAFTALVAVVAAVTVLVFGCLHPNLLPSTLDPAWNVTVANGSSTPYTLRIMSWASLTLLPLVMLYQGWSYWVFRHRVSTEAIPASIGLARRRS